MKPIKIQISPEIREFNEQIEHADFLLDYQFDQEPASVLLDRLQQAKAYPVSCSLLKYAITRLAIKRNENSALVEAAQNAIELNGQ